MVSIRNAQVTDRAGERGADQDHEQRLGADVGQEDREQERGGDRADLADRGGEARAGAAQAGRKHFAGEQIGLRVRPDVGHEVEQHEACEDQRRAGGVVRVGGERREREPGRASDETQNLQPHAPHPVGEQHRKDDADDQQNVDQGRALGGELIVGDQVGEVAGVRRLVAKRRGENRRRENPDAVGAEVLQEPRHRGEDGGAPVVVSLNNAA